MARKKRLDEVISFKLRMPEGLRQKIETEATNANRSMNSEILWRLGQTFGEAWQRFIAGVEEKEKEHQEHVDQMMQDPRLRELVDRWMEELMEKHPEVRKNK
jgi:hypothetical protein